MSQISQIRAVAPHMASACSPRTTPVREGVRCLLETRPGLEVVASCGDLDRRSPRSTPNSRTRRRHGHPHALAEPTRELKPPATRLAAVGFGARRKLVHRSTYALPAFGGTAGRAYLLKGGSGRRRHRRGDRGRGGRRLRDRPSRGRDPRGQQGPRRGVGARRADAAGAGRAARDGRGEEQRGDRPDAVPQHALGRESDPLDLPQARDRVGDLGAPGAQAAIMYLGERG